MDEWKRAFEIVSLLQIVSICLEHFLALDPAHPKNLKI